MHKLAQPSTSRRDLLRALSSGVVLLPVAGLVACSGDQSPPAQKPAPAPAAPPAAPPPAETAAPQAMPESATPSSTSQLAKLSEDDPIAVALGYKHDATTVDTAKYPRYQSGQICRNCSLYQGKADEEWGLCTLFPGKQVNAQGWCASYAPKT